MVLFKVYLKSEVVIKLYNARLTFYTNSLYRRYAVALYLFLLFMIGRFTFLYEAEFGFIVSLIYVIAGLFIALEWPNEKMLILGGFVLLTLSKIVYGLTFDPIVGSDELTYYNQMNVLIGDFSAYLSYVWDKLTLQPSQYPGFGIVFMPIFYMFGSNEVSIIIIFNTILLIVLAYLVYKINKLFLKGTTELNNKNKRVYLAIITTFVLISPTFMYWSSTFAKDLASVTLGFLAIYMLMKRKYFKFVLALGIASIFRPYVVAFVVGYYFVYKKNMKLATLSTICSVLLVVLLTRGITGLFNTFVTMGYFFMAPNPFDLENWSNYQLMSFESLMSIVLLFLTIILYIKKKETRRFLNLCFLGVYVYACAMTAVGNYVLVDTLGMSYGIGDVGDNMTRKKLPIMILLYTVYSYTIAHIFIKGRKSVNSNSEQNSNQLN